LTMARSKRGEVIVFSGWSTSGERRWVILGER
jgi:hypothetical protein